MACVDALRVAVYGVDVKLGDVVPSAHWVAVVYGDGAYGGMGEEDARMGL